VTSIDVLTLSDVALKVSTTDTILQGVGFSSGGDVERFISAWSRALARVSSAHVPHGVAFRLVPSSLPNVDDAAVAALFDVLHEAQTQGEILEVNTSGAATKRIPLAQDVKAQLQAGMWPPHLVAQVSDAEKCCMAYVTGKELRIYGSGTEAIVYQDVVYRIIHSTHDPLRREFWGDGELLVKCADERLPDRGRLGIWEDADRFLLKNSPEELIEEVLTRYLEARLRGFASVARQAIVPTEGRVDVLVTLADGMQYIVELKWIGRSAKRNIRFDDDQVQRELDTKWRCKHVFVIGEESAQAGAIQMSFYFRKHRPRKVYLVAYDCRRIEDQKGSSCVAQYPAPPKLTPSQYRIYHVGVDPRVASVKGKTMLAASKKTQRPPIARSKSRGGRSMLASPGRASKKK
jgi:hypothetical protein